MATPNETLVKQLYHALETIFPRMEHSGVLLDSKTGGSQYYVHDKIRTETEGITYRITFENITEEVRSNIKHQEKE